MIQTHHQQMGRARWSLARTEINLALVAPCLIAMEVTQLKEFQHKNVAILYMLNLVNLVKLDMALIIH